MKTKHELSFATIFFLVSIPVIVAIVLAANSSKNFSNAPNAGGELLLPSTPATGVTCLLTFRFDRNGQIDENLKTEALNALQATRLDLQNTNSDVIITKLLKTPNPTKGETNPYLRFNPKYATNTCFKTEAELAQKVSKVFLNLNPNIQKLLTTGGPMISEPQLVKSTFGDGVKECAYTIVYKN